jgi:diguanylate cyclase (GGDEF)-like protein
MLSKFNVLLVEDDPDKQMLLKVALEMAGYNVHTADDGVEGLLAVESMQPDLIVTDVMMPNMDGYEMVRRVRANPSTRFIPVIIQTAARGDTDDVRRGAEVGALGYITDPTDLDLLLARARTLLDFKNYLDTCEEQVFTDDLTGLYNRRRFKRELGRALLRAKQTRRPACLLIFDIDNFKRINDTYGHKVGDLVITAMATPLQAIKQGKDIAARIGGEEFAIILPDTNLPGGLEVAERIRLAIKELRVSSVETITVSCGVAEYPLCAVDDDSLFIVADAALYQAKDKGRDRVESAKQLQEDRHIMGDVKGQ